MAAATAPPTDLTTALTTAPHAFLQPAPALHASAVAFLKQTLDPVAAEISQVQQERLQEARRKRKRGGGDVDEDVLRLKRIYTQGMEVGMVWEQVRRVVEAVRGEVGGVLEELVGGGESGEEESGEEEGEGEGRGELSDGGDSEDEELENEGDAEGLVDGEEEDEEDEEEEFDMERDDFEDEDAEDEEPAEEFKADKFGLNDGFFSIDDFNRQSEFLEQADMRGDNDDQSDDEEEDIDWHGNPLGAGAGAKVTDGDADMDDASDDDEDGPTFGNVDLNAPEGASDDGEDSEVEEGEMDAMGSLSNTNDIKYADFFAPPAQKVRKNKKGRPNPHNFPAQQIPNNGAQPAEEQEEDLERTMQAVHRDLFDDEDSEPEDESAETLDPADPRSRKSTHERRRAALAAEIRKLEAANVAKREWTLAGEARAADRPMNSLLEEDLDFERAGKPVPVITAEVSEEIEDLIKRRILANDFNDIPRRRPDDLATGPRRGRVGFELDDGKSKKSLAEMYEEEHLKNTDPNYVEAKDEKSAKDQKEIEGLWKDIVRKLDSLSSWHFKPSAPATQLDIRVDAPVVRLEDARPTAGADAAGASQLAPQEVYRAGEAVERESEVATKGGLVVGREEMSREEKKRRRRREKERGRKAGGGAQEGEKKESRKTTERKGIVADLKRGGVKVIGKKGEIRDVEGKRVREGEEGPRGAAGFKL